MKKKLLLSVLAAGLVLPSAAALANEEDKLTDESLKTNVFYPNATSDKLAVNGGSIAVNAVPGQDVPVTVEKEGPAVLETAKGTGVTVVSELPEGTLPEGTLPAGTKPAGKEEVKPAVKPAQKVDAAVKAAKGKAAKTTAKKALPKTSAVK